MSTESIEQRYERALSLRVARVSGDDDCTVRELLADLLDRVWYQGEAFSGKRPWGYSDWKIRIVDELGKAGLVPGQLMVTPKGEFYAFAQQPADETATDEFMRELIAYMCGVDWT